MGTWATSPETLALVLKAEREPPVHVPYSAWGERVDDIIKVVVNVAEGARQVA